jgi:hypothetical protein
MEPRPAHKLTPAAIAAMLLLGGCSYLYPEQEARPSVQVDRNPAKYDAGSGQSLTAAESSLLLSEKYAILSVDSEKLRQENKRLSDDNVALAKQNAQVQAELDQAAKELKEANAMMIDMRIEMNNWKNSVLGFRDEMRESQKAQLEALIRIMQLLGGDSQKEPPATAATEEGHDPNAKK